PEGPRARGPLQGALLPRPRDRAARGGGTHGAGGAVMTGAATTSRPLLSSERLRVALLMVPDGAGACVTLNAEAARALLDELRAIREMKAAEFALAAADEAAGVLAEARDLLAEADERARMARRDMILTLAG